MSPATAAPLSAVDSAFEDNTHGVLLGIGMSSDFIADSCTFARNTHAVTIAGGTITADTTWDLSSAYSMYLAASVTVDAGATLRVAPGTVVKADYADAIYVLGTLITEGTETAPVVFTHPSDDSAGGDANGDGDASAPGISYWRGIQITGGGSAALTHTRVSYGGWSEYVNLSKSGTGSLTLDHARLTHAPNGLAVSSNTGALQASASSFTDNGNGVWLGVDTSSDFLDAGCSFASNTHDVALQGGTMGASATWALKSAYSMFLQGNLTVANGATLTVAPGTVVKPAYAAGLFVKGAISALGTVGSPVYFTDERDDTVGGDANNDGDASAPGPGRWRGIQLSEGGSGRFDYTTIRYGGYSERVDLSMTGAGDLSLLNSELTDAYGNGLVVDTATGSFDAKGTLFARNSDRGIHFNAPAAGTALSGCRIESNTNYGVFNAGPNVVDARNNWWGDPSGPFHPTTNPNGLGDRVSDKVLFDPWRRTEAASGILAPMHSGAILQGDALRFIGAASIDPSNSYLWDFGDGRTARVQSPGLLSFHQAGEPRNPLLPGRLPGSAGPESRQPPVPDRGGLQGPSPISRSSHSRSPRTCPSGSSRRSLIGCRTQVTPGSPAPPGPTPSICPLTPFLTPVTSISRASTARRTSLLAQPTMGSSTSTSRWYTTAAPI